MILRLKLWLVVSLGIAGCILFLYYNDYPFRLQNIVFSFLGLFAMDLSFSYFWWKAHEGESREVKLDVLLDLCLNGFVLLLIPLFDLISAPVELWALLVLTPSIIARFIIALVRKKRRQGKRAFLLWDDAGVWVKQTST